MLKAGLALLFSYVILPHVRLTSELSAIYMLLLLVKEAIWGAVLSYMLAFPIWIIESAGKFIDQQRGEQMGATVNKLTNDPSSSLGALIVQAMLTYIVANQGFIFICSILFKSFNLLPINAFSMGLDKQVIISMFIDYSYYWVILALPVVLLMFVVDFTFGLVGSFIPQLNATVVAMPIKSIIAMSILTIYLTSMFHTAIDKFMLHMKIFL